LRLRRHRLLAAAGACAARRLALLRAVLAWARTRRARARGRRLRTKATRLWLHGRWLHLLRQRAAAAEARARARSRATAADARAARGRLARGMGALHALVARRAVEAARRSRHEAAATQLRGWRR